MEAGGESNLGSVIKDIVANQKFERVQEVYIVGTSSLNKTSRLGLIATSNRQ